MTEIVRRTVSHIIVSGRPTENPDIDAAVYELLPEAPPHHGDVTRVSLAGDTFAVAWVLVDPGTMQAYAWPVDAAQTTP